MCVGGRNSGFTLWSLWSRCGFPLFYIIISVLRNHLFSSDSYIRDKYKLLLLHYRGIFNYKQMHPPLFSTGHAVYEGFLAYVDNCPCSSSTWVFQCRLPASDFLGQHRYGAAYPCWLLPWLRTHGTHLLSARNLSPFPQYFPIIN